MLLLIHEWEGLLEKWHHLVILSGKRLYSILLHRLKLPHLRRSILYLISWSEQIILNVDLSIVIILTISDHGEISHERVVNWRVHLICLGNTCLRPVKRWFLTILDWHIPTYSCWYFLEIRLCLRLIIRLENRLWCYSIELRILPFCLFVMLLLDSIKEVLEVYWTLTLPLNALRLPLLHCHVSFTTNEDIACTVDLFLQVFIIIVFLLLDQSRSVIDIRTEVMNELIFMHDNHCRHVLLRFVFNIVDEAGNVIGIGVNVRTNIAHLFQHSRLVNLVLLLLSYVILQDYLRHVRVLIRVRWWNWINSGWIYYSSLWIGKHVDGLLFRFVLLQNWVYIRVVEWVDR